MQRLIHTGEDADDQTSVEYSDEYEKYAGKNANLSFNISSHYDIEVKFYYTTMKKTYFWTVYSSGDGGEESNIAYTREECLKLVRKTYGAPHTDEFEALVDRLLISQEELNSFK